MVQKNNAWKGITHICADCDNILRAVKRELENDYALKIQKIYDYITPAQLSSIIIARPYSTHLIKAEEAKQLIDTITSSYQDQQLN